MKPFSAADTGAATKVFDTENSWSLYRGRDSYELRMNRRNTNDPWMTAAFGPGLARVDLHCDPEIADQEGTMPFLLRYPLDQVLLMFYLASRSGAVIHSAGIVKDGRGYLFPGCSGAGKTTLARIFASRADVIPLSDDRTVVRKIGGEFRVFGTPWPGDAKIAANASAPLAGIFFPEKANENRIEPLGASAALKRFLPVVSAPWFDPEASNGVLSFLENLVTEVPAHLMKFRLGGEIGDTFSAYLHGN